MKMFSGLRSRCTMPAACASCRASAIGQKQLRRPRFQGQAWLSLQDDAQRFAVEQLHHQHRIRVVQKDVDSRGRWRREQRAAWRAPRASRRTRATSSESLFRISFERDFRGPVRESTAAQTVPMAGLHRSAGRANSGASGRPPVSCMVDWRRKHTTVVGWRAGLKPETRWIAEKPSVLLISTSQANGHRPAARSV